MTVTGPETATRVLTRRRGLPKSVAPEVELVTSTQHRPDSGREGQRVIGARHVVRGAAGGAGLRHGRPGAPWSRSCSSRVGPGSALRSVTLVLLDPPWWCGWGATVCDPVSRSTTTRTMTPATAVAGAASRRGRWLIEPIALSRLATGRVHDRGWRGPGVIERHRVSGSDRRRGHGRYGRPGTVTRTDADRRHPNRALGERRLCPMAGLGDGTGAVGCALMLSSVWSERWYPSTECTSCAPPAWSARRRRAPPPLQPPRSHR